MVCRVARPARGGLHGLRSTAHGLPFPGRGDGSRMNAALRSLTRRPRRTILTVAGVAAAACAYMLLVGSAQGFLAQFRKLSTLFGADLVLLQAGSTSPWNSVLPVQPLAKLGEIGDIAGVSRLALGKARIVGAPFFLLFGLDPAEPLLGHLAIVRGRTLRPGADEMLLGSLAATRLGIGCGGEIDVRARRLRVVGVYRTGHRVVDAGGVLDLATTQRLFNLHDAVSLVFLDLAAPSAAGSAAARITARVPNVVVASAGEWVESYGQLVVVEDFARFLAVLALLIAVLGVANVLHVSVGERTQELAVLRAIGWRRQRVAAHILTECGLVTLLGAAVAVPMAELILLLIDSAWLGSLETAGFLPPHLSGGVILEGIVVACLAGLLGAAAPLLRAIRVRPADALRGA
ncbi:MAG: ABC transporter permease [Acidobacteria bacterium]|nr:MAG: ABC transporter permease [Acidobacteriota bacterium]